MVLHRVKHLRSRKPLPCVIVSCKANVRDSEPQKPVCVPALGGNVDFSKFLWPWLNDARAWNEDGDECGKELSQQAELRKACLQG